MSFACKLQREMCERKKYFSILAIFNVAKADPLPLRDAEVRSSTYV